MKLGFGDSSIPLHIPNTRITIPFARIFRVTAQVHSEIFWIAPRVKNSLSVHLELMQLLSVLVLTHAVMKQGVHVEMTREQ